MKKFYFLSLLAMTVTLQAQTMLVNDFESGLGGAYVAWGGNCEIIANPASGASNSSAQALKITATDYAPVGFPVTLPTGKTLKDYSGIRFQATVLPGATNISWIGFNAGVSQNTSTMDIVDPTSGQSAAWGDGVVNKWVDVELQFNEILLTQFVNSYTSGHYNVMIKLGRGSFIYAVDNIRLIEKDIPLDPNTIFTFETMDLGPSTRIGMPWSGTASVVENPVKTGINTSNKSLQVVSPEYSPVTFFTALPSGKTWSDFDGLTFQFCATAGTDIDWGGCEVGIRLDNGQHEKIGAAYGSNGEEGAAFGDINLNEWMNIELGIKESLITTTANTSGTLYIRVMKNLTYLIDNITLSPKAPNSVNSQYAGVSTVKAFGYNGAIRMAVSADTEVNVYGIDGRLVYNKAYLPGTYEISLPAGVYVVNKQKVIVY